MNEKVDRKIFTANKQTYVKANDVCMKRLCSTSIAYEKPNGGPMKRSCSNVFGYEMTLAGPMKRLFSRTEALLQTLD